MKTQNRTMRSKTPNPAPTPEAEPPRVIERPDGFYWRNDDGREYGPFATLVEALQDQEGIGDEEAIEPEESLAEAEAEIGMVEVDPEARTLAEEDGAPVEEH